MAKGNKTTKKTATATSISKMKQTDGALLALQTIDEIIGKKTVGYKHETLAEYSKYINSLELHDLHEHAIQVAKTVPINNRSLLIDRLEREFARDNGSKMYKHINSTVSMDEENKRKILAILNK